MPFHTLLPGVACLLFAVACAQRSDRAHPLVGLLVAAGAGIGGWAVQSGVQQMAVQTVDAAPVVRDVQAQLVDAGPGWAEFAMSFDKLRPGCCPVSITPQVVRGARADHARDKYSHELDCRAPGPQSAGVWRWEWDPTPADTAVQSYVRFRCEKGRTAPDLLIGPLALPPRTSP